MSRRTFRITVEKLESRCLLSGSGWFEDSGQRPGKNSLIQALGDLDNDGDLDALVGCYNFNQFRGPCEQNTVWMNNGEGNLELSGSLSSDAGTTADIALGDLDGDGDLDAFVGKGAPGRAPGSPDDFRSEVWLNDGQGNFSDSEQRLGRLTRTWDVELGDLDGDGDLDALVGNGTGESTVWLNDGKAVFTDTEQLLGDGSVVALGDIDVDGDLDAYLGNNREADRVWFNDGQGNFADSGQRLGKEWGFGAQFGDLDGDGDLDVFVANGIQDTSAIAQPNVVWLNDGSGNFTDSGQQIGEAISTGVELGDLDGDGDLDAFVANGATVRNHPDKVWLNDGAANFTDSGQSFPRATSWRAALGDLDGDGDLDAIVGRHSRNTEVWWNIVPPVLDVAGDANRDGQFNQLDIVHVLQANKYLTGESATFEEGDWNGDDVFDQLDIIAALQTGSYLQSSVGAFDAVGDGAHPSPEG